MAHPALTRFIEEADRATVTADPHAAAAAAGAALGDLLAHPEFLETRHRRPDTDAYAQHVVHVHPQGRYSIVALVWTPGQSTPIHDHVCWCVVGVLIGSERETRFELSPDGDALIRGESTEYGPGDVAVVVPPDVDIHHVENVGADVAISIHVYGADISRLGTSINRRYDLPIRTAVRS